MSKFATDLDELVYDLSLDGTDPTIDNGGGVTVDHYTLVRLDDRTRESLSDQSGEIVNAARVIVHEDDQGFVSTEWFDTIEAADTRWAELEAL